MNLVRLLLTSDFRLYPRPPTPALHFGSRRIRKSTPCDLPGFSRANNFKADDVFGCQQRRDIIRKYNGPYLLSTDQLLRFYQSAFDARYPKVTVESTNTDRVVNVIDVVFAAPACLK